MVNDKLLMYNIRNIDATKHKTASTAIGIVEAGDSLACPQQLSSLLSASFVGSGYIIGSGTYTWVDLDDADGWGNRLLAPCHLAAHFESVCCSGHGLVMFPVFFIVGQTAMVATVFISNLVSAHHSKAPLSSSSRSAHLSSSRRWEEETLKPKCATVADTS